MQMVDEVCKPENNSKGHDGSQQSKQQNILKVFTKIFLLEIVPTSEDHRRQQTIEEDLLVEIDLVDIVYQVHDGPEHKTDKNADTSLMNGVNLRDLRGTLRCSRVLPMIAYIMMRMMIPIKISENSSRSI